MPKKKGKKKREVYDWGIEKGSFWIRVKAKNAKEAKRKIMRRLKVDTI